MQTFEFYAEYQKISQCSSIDSYIENIEIPIVITHNSYEQAYAKATDLAFEKCPCEYRLIRFHRRAG